MVDNKKKEKFDLGVKGLMYHDKTYCNFRSALLQYQATKKARSTKHVQKTEKALLSNSLEIYS